MHLVGILFPHIKYCSLHFFCSAISSIPRKLHGIYLVRSAKTSQGNPSIFGTTVVANSQILSQFLSWFYVFKLHDYIKLCSANVVKHLLEIVYNIMTYELSCIHLIQHWLLHVTSIELCWNYNKLIRQYKWFSVAWPTSLPYGEKMRLLRSPRLLCFCLSVCLLCVSHHFMLQQTLPIFTISSTDITSLEATHCHYFTLFVNKITSRVN